MAPGRWPGGDGSSPCRPGQPPPVQAWEKLASGSSPSIIPYSQRNFHSQPLGGTGTAWDALLPYSLWLASVLPPCQTSFVP